MNQPFAIQLPEIPDWVVVSAATIEAARELPVELFGSEVDKEGLLSYAESGRVIFLISPNTAPGRGVPRFEISEMTGLAFEKDDAIETVRQAVVDSFAGLYGSLEAKVESCAFLEIDGRRWLRFVENLLESSNRVAYFLPRPDRLTTLSITLVAPADLVEAHAGLAEKLVRGVEIFEQSDSPEASRVSRRASDQRLVSRADSLEEAVEMAWAWQKSG